MEDREYICRCEDVDRQAVGEAVRRGYKTPEEIKRLTRCGMGPCQGRTCLPMLLDEISSVVGVSRADLLPSSVRPPNRPVALGELAEAKP